MSVNDLNNFISIRLYADSLGLPRIGSVLPVERYFYLLQNYFYEQKKYRLDIIDRSKPGLTVKDLHYSCYQDSTYFGELTDLIIIQVGIVDCAPRPIPIGLRNFISTLPSFIKSRIINFIHNNRSKLLKYGFKFYTVNKEEFEQIYFKWLSDIIKTTKKIVVINISPTNAKIEAHSPGLEQSIFEYNLIIKNVISKVNSQNIYMIDVERDIIRDKKFIDEYILEDGHHISALMHEKIFEKIIQYWDK